MIESRVSPFRNCVPHKTTDNKETGNCDSRRENHTIGANSRALPMLPLADKNSQVAIINKFKDTKKNIAILNEKTGAGAVAH